VLQELQIELEGILYHQFSKLILYPAKLESIARRQYNGFCCIMPAPFLAKNVILCV